MVAACPIPPPFSQGLDGREDASWGSACGMGCCGRSCINLRCGYLCRAPTSPDGVTMAGMPQNYSICVVCSGNICRSPIGEAIIRNEIRKAGLDSRVKVCSAGTGSWHIGEGADHRATAVARSHGLDLAQHRAEVFEPEHLDRIDLVLALDSGHLDALQRLARDEGARAKVRLLRSFDPEAVADDDLEVADP